MTDGRMTRMETHIETIENLLKSNEVESIKRRLYGREIRALRKRFPQVKVEIESSYRDSLYNCKIKK